MCFICRWLSPACLTLQGHGGSPKRRRFDARGRICRFHRFIAGNLWRASELPLWMYANVPLLLTNHFLPGQILIFCSSERGIGCILNEFTASLPSHLHTRTASELRSTRPFLLVASSPYLGLLLWGGTLQRSHLNGKHDLDTIGCPMVPNFF